MISPSEKKKLKERMVLPIIITVILYLSPSFITVPIIEELQSFEKSLDAGIASVKKDVALKNQYHDQMQKMDELRRGVSRLEKWIQPESYLPDVIDKLNSLAEIFSIQIISSHYTFVVPQVNWPGKVGMNLVVRADYPALKGFLKSLEGFPLPLFPSEIVARDDGNISIQLQHLVKME